MTNQKEKDAPRSVRWKPSEHDESVIEWLESQKNVNGSLRKLILDSIERDGMTDIFYKPTKQLPRRGRPRLEDEAEFEVEVETAPAAKLVSTPKPEPVQPTSPQAPAEPVKPRVRVDPMDLLGQTDQERYAGMSPDEIAADQAKTRAGLNDIMGNH